MSYEYLACTDPGRVRSNNEDAVAVDPEHGLALLADGMGGYNAGEVASDLAIQHVREAVQTWLRQWAHRLHPAEVSAVLEESIQTANAAILDAATAEPEYAGMGTTMVAALFLPGRVVVAHVGDSRCYRLRGEQLRQLTRDHSWLQEQVDAGLMSEEQAAAAGYRNLVTRALGADARVQVDVNDYGVEPHDLFLLCSDGLSDMLEDAHIAHTLLLENLTLQQKATALIAQANARGGRDNISVVLVQATGDAPTRRGRVARWLRTGFGVE